MGLTRYSSSFMYGVKPHDAVTFVLVSAILAIRSLLASCATRLRIDRMVAIRHE